MDLKNVVIIPFTRLLTVIMYDKIVYSNTTQHTTFIYKYIYIYIRGVTGGTDQTSGGCSLCYTIPI